ncbi:cytochrome P450 [Lactarius quietus]|nr:cytochrome P450 [Lactarius quietus]
MFYVRSPWRELPPGPQRTPIIGNPLQLVDIHWLTSKVARILRIGTVGEVMYLDAAGLPTIVLNSFKSTVELLERRSNNDSDRQRLIMAQEILCKSLVLAFMNNTTLWRRQRRAAQAALREEAVRNFYPIITKEATILASTLLKRSSISDRNKHL